MRVRDSQSIKAARLLCEAIVVEAVEGACGDLGAHVARGASIGTRRVFSGECVLGYIGFHGEHVRGTLSIVLDEPVAAQLHAAILPGSRAPAEEDLMDLAGELANQVMGRIANAMRRRYDCPLTPSLPMALMGARIRLGEVRDRNTATHRGLWHRFRAPAGVIQARMDVLSSPDFALVEQPVPASTLEEGDILWFDR